MQTLQTEFWISSKTRYTEYTDTYLHFPQFVAFLQIFLAGTLASAQEHVHFYISSSYFDSNSSYTAKLPLLSLFVRWLFSAFYALPMAGCPQLGLTSWWGNQISTCHLGASVDWHAAWHLIFYCQIILAIFGNPFYPWFCDWNAVLTKVCEWKLTWIQIMYCLTRARRHGCHSVLRSKKRSWCVAGMNFVCRPQRDK